MPKLKLKLSVPTRSDIKDFGVLQPENWRSIMPNMYFYNESGFCYLVQARLGQELVGAGAAIMHKNCIWLANIMVAKAHRNKGFGKTITQHLIEYAQKYSESILLIATRSGQPLYEQYGFTPYANGEYAFYHPLPSAIRNFDSGFITTYTPQFKEQLFQLDFEVSGEQRTHILEPHLENAHLYVHNNQLEGFYLPDLGEGPVLAATEEAGISLLSNKLANREIGFAIPKENRAANLFLKSRGFNQMNDLYGVKMYLGKPIEWKPELTFGRIGGNMG